LLLQGAAFAAAFVAYRLLAPGLLATGAGDRLSFLAPHGPDPRAAAMTLGFLFGWGSFSIWAWLCAVLAATLLVWRAPGGARALAVYCGAMVVAGVVAANFPGSLRFPAEGSTLGRFLLQVPGVFLPLCCAYAVAALAPTPAPPATGARRRAEPR